VSRDLNEEITRGFIHILLGILVVLLGQLCPYLKSLFSSTSFGQDSRSLEKQKQQNVASVSDGSYTGNLF